MRGTPTGDARGSPPFTAPCPGSGRPLAVQRRAALTLRSKCLALGNANANGTIARVHRRSATRHCPDATSRRTRWLHSHARVRRAPAARETTRHRRCAVMRPIVLPFAAHAALRPCWLRRAATAATGRSGLRSVAKGCALLQQIGLRCNRVRCAATTGCAAGCGTRCTATIGGCAALQSLQQVAADCGLLQRAVPCCNR